LNGPTPDGPLTRRIVARIIVAILGGVVLGYFFGASVASDAARARSLTLKEYIADFDTYRKGLLKSDVPMWGAILTMIVMVIALAGVYELLVLAVDKLLRRLDRQS
jgi:amino acid transporter